MSEDLERRLKRALEERDMANDSRMKLEFGLIHVEKLLDSFVDSIDVQFKRRKKASEWLEKTKKELMAINNGNATK